MALIPKISSVVPSIDVNPRHLLNHLYITRNLLGLPNLPCSNRRDGHRSARLGLRLRFGFLRCLGAVATFFVLSAVLASLMRLCVTPLVFVGALDKHVQTTARHVLGINTVAP